MVATRWAFGRPQPPSQPLSSRRSARRRYSSTPSARSGIGTPSGYPTEHEAHRGRVCGSGHLPRPACETARAVKAPRKTCRHFCPYHRTYTSSLGLRLRTLRLRPEEQRKPPFCFAPPGATLRQPRCHRLTLDERCSRPSWRRQASPRHARTIILIPGMSRATGCNTASSGKLSWFVNGPSSEPAPADPGGRGSALALVRRLGARAVNGWSSC